MGMIQGQHFPRFDSYPRDLTKYINKNKTVCIQKCKEAKENAKLCMCDDMAQTHAWSMPNS